MWGDQPTFGRPPGSRNYAGGFHPIAASEILERGADLRLPLKQAAAKLPPLTIGNLLKLKPLASRRYNHSALFFAHLRASVKGPSIRKMFDALPAIPIPSGSELAAMLIVVCFSAGLNVYATVGMLGLLSRVHALSLPPSLHGLENWYVIAVCAVLFLVEFIGDKIPVFDLLWNALHTFVRIPVAAALAYAATAQLPPWQQIMATLAGSLLALAAHGGKTAARAAVTHSPEPFSNIALSLSEDASVVFLMWFATRHPYIAAAIIVAAVALIIVMVRLIVGALRNLFRDAEATIAADTGSSSSLKARTK